MIHSSESQSPGGLALHLNALSGARIAVVGFGWYGGHTALTLLRAGADVVVFEAEDRAFAGASGHNQNRLHQGFHYPRSHVTREQSRRGFQRFEDEYPLLSQPIDRNLFAIAERDSLIDFETYVDVMRVAGLQFELVQLEDSSLANVTGVVACEERLIDTVAAERHLTQALEGRTRFGTLVRQVQERDSHVFVGGERFDAAVLCTWGTFTPRPQWDVFFEPSISLIYEALYADEPAITIMDGPFFSLFPLRDRLFTLTSVARTPLARVESPDLARRVIRAQSAEDTRAIREASELEFETFSPGFRSRFRFVEPDYAIKTKIRDASSARPALVHLDGRVVDILAGKIDAVFEATDQTIAYLAQLLDGALVGPAAS